MGPVLCRFGRRRRGQAPESLWDSVVERLRSRQSARSEASAIVAEANAENARLTPQGALGPFHRFGDLDDRSAGL
jgi:hypothetical protein